MRTISSRRVMRRATKTLNPLLNPTQVTIILNLDPNSPVRELLSGRERNALTSTLDETADVKLECDSSFVLSMTWCSYTAFKAG